VAFDAFLSYSRKDLPFAVELERALERYTPPREIRAERRPVTVFRDQDDLTGPEYHAAIDNHLTRSNKLVLICSPYSRASEYVNDEIRRFAAIHGSGGIIPVLLSGVPNNAARDGDENNLAFPDALCELVAMPLAIPYGGFDPERDRVNKGVFYGSWYTLLANLLDVDRATIEERDRRRRVRVRNTWIGGTSGVVAALSALTLWAVMERNTAVHRGQITLAQRLAAQARVATTLEPDAAERRAILGIEAVRRLEALGEPTYDGVAALRDASAIVARRVVHLESSQRDVLFSGDGVTLFAASGPNVSVYSLRTGTRTAAFDASAPVDQLFASSDGRFVGAVTADGRVTVWLAREGRPVTGPPLADGMRIVCGALSADGHYLAALATDRTASRAARLFVWRADSARLVAQERLAVPNATSVGPVRNCLQVGTDYLMARFRSSDTASTITGAVWQWRPANEGDALSFRFRPGGDRLPPRQWRQLAQMTWVTDSSSLTLLDAEGTVTSVPLDGGANVVPAGPGRISALSSDGETLVRTRWSEDPYVPLLTSWTLTSIDRRSGKEGGVVAETTDRFALAPDGTMLVTGGGHRLRLWRMSDGRELMRIGSPISVDAMMVSPAARYVAAFDTTRAVDIWDVGHASELLRIPTGRVAAASANGKRIAIGTSLGVVVVDDSSGNTIASVPLVDGAGLIALSPDGRYLVASGGNPSGFNFRPQLLRTVVLDLAGSPDTVFTAGRATGAEFSPDGRSLLLGTADSTVRNIGLSDRTVRWVKRFDSGSATRFSPSRRDGHGPGSLATRRRGRWTRARAGRAPGRRTRPIRCGC
jgi:WD40 repeat protein